MSTEVSKVRTIAIAGQNGVGKTSVADALVYAAGGNNRLGRVDDETSLFDTEPEEMDAYFPELAPLVMDCQFSDCSHTHEPGCAVQAALKSGTIHPARFDSYLRLKAGQD